VEAAGAAITTLKRQDPWRSRQAFERVLSVSGNRFSSMNRLLIAYYLKTRPPEKLRFTAEGLD